MAYQGSAGKTFTAQLRIAAGGMASSTLSGAVTLDGQSSNFLQYDPGGSSRNVTFPAEDGFANAIFFVHNNASDAGELLALKDDAGVTKLSLDKGEVGMMVCDGTSWYGLPLSIVPELGDGQNITLGALPDDTIGHDGTNTTWTHVTGDLIIDSTDVNDQIIFRVGTDTTATGIEFRNNSDAAMWSINPISASAGRLIAPDNSTLVLGTGGDDTISHNGTNTIWSHITGDLIFDNVLVTGSTIMLLGTDTTAVDFQVQNNSGAALLTVTPTSATGGTVVASGLRSVSATAAAITGVTTLTAADSGGVFSVAKTSAYAITLPTPAQGFYFKFLILDTGANAVTFSDGAAHLFGQIQEAGTVPIAMTGTTLTAAASQSVGDWLCFEGIDATHYLVTGSSIQASKFTIA